MRDLFLDGRAIDHVQRLAERRAHFFARAHGLAIAAAEGGQEIIRRLAVRDFDRARAGGQAFVFLLGLGHLADAVEHDLGAHAADRGLREIAVVERVGFVRARRGLISARSADVAHDVTEIVVILDDLFRQRL